VRDKRVTMRRDEPRGRVRALREQQKRQNGNDDA